MNKKFPYGHDVNVYIDKAIEKMKELYPWVTKEMLDKNYKLSIEKIGNRYEYVSDYQLNDYKSRRILKVNGEEFIDNIIEMEEFSVQNSNPIKDIFKLPYDGGKELHGWYLEHYDFRSHKLGGYSVFVQAGDRTTGGSRTFFIPNDYFKGTYEEFLDKYIKLVPSYFGFTKEELLNTKGLKEFLGF